MDNAMVKRAIGALVLAIIAALLLGWLLKDKSQERQDMVEMKLPGAPEMNIPSLIGSDDAPSSVATLVNETTAKASDSVKNAGSEIVAAVTNTASEIKESVIPTMQPTDEKASNSSKPGFSIRPSNNNEQREVVDIVKKSTTDKTQNDTTKRQAESNDVVIASTEATPKKSFTPTIIEEKKKTAIKKVVKTPKRSKQKEAVKKTTKDTPVSSETVVAGKYSIQLLATSSQSRAKKLARTMKDEGYKSFITHTTKKNKVLYRVRLGTHNNRSAALTAQQNLKRRYQKNFFVQNSLVVSN